MKLHFAIATLIVLGFCAVFSTRMPADSPSTMVLLSSGGGVPTPCPNPPRLTSRTGRVSLQLQAAVVADTTTCPFGSSIPHISR